MTKKYFSKIARVAAATALATGLTFFPARNAAAQNQHDSMSVMEQIIDAHFNPKPGNLWEDVLEGRKEAKKQMPALKIVNSRQNYSPKQVLQYFNKNLGLKYGYKLSVSDKIRNEGIIKDLHDTEFDYLVRKIGFDNVRSLVMTKEECGKYPLGNERAEKLRGLVGMINNSVKGKNVNAMQVLAHISVESGGYNRLNCEAGGGVFHILYIYNGGKNPLNANKNVARGVEIIEYLTNQFGNSQTAAVAFNTSNGRLIKAKREFERYMKRSPSHLEIMAYLKRTHPESYKKSERYEKLLKGHERFLEKYFSYDEKNNRVMIIPQIKYSIKSDYS